MSIDLNDEWESFLNNYDENSTAEFTCPAKATDRKTHSDKTPECDELYISTKTMLLYLNHSNIDVATIFWKLPVVEYWKPLEGIIKKQMKVAAHTKSTTQLRKRTSSRTSAKSPSVFPPKTSPIIAAKRNAGRCSIVLPSLSGS